VDAPAAKAAPKGGAVGVGTWSTQAEYKDIKVTRGNETLYTGDLARGTEGWRLLGGGDWQAEAGVLRQTGNRENVRAITGDRSWTDYTYSLKARKLGGAEGFLILFNVQDDEAKSWWNLGGWGNREHGVEIGGIVTQTPGSIETGRWYDIRIELQGGAIKCFLDGKLIHDVSAPTVMSLYASASVDRKSDETIVKVVNASFDALETEIELRGIRQAPRELAAVVLTSASATDENTLDNPRKVAPRTTTIPVTGTVLRHPFPGNSLTILRFKTVK
jgi:alpha-L-arabinofuranosidase